ncbi:hypothetical protein [Deinococcus budaensis]|uniref:Uncharacterized protein n=1 Tax=Deinococcus budaensis TaxID=1665626 RepID=A0A7W8LRA1_9DEIO|nr:hypothetical protein [Deinococcus budaensis]MBB5235445.1 hypothetical protein [Deinococcus budaensis]
MKRLGVGMALAALAAGTAGAERFGVQLGVGAGGGGVGVQAGAYARVAGFGPAQLEARGTFEQALSGSGGTRVGADALVSVNLLLLRPYAGLGLSLPLGGAGNTALRSTVGARFGLPGPLSGFAEGSFGGQNVYRAGLLLRF